MDYTLENFKSLEIYTSIKSKELIKIVDAVLEDANIILGKINGEYKEYTFHDIGHAYRVAKYMEDLVLGIDEELRDNRKKQFSELEFAIMLIVAALHDIGMFFTEDEYSNIVSQNELYLNKFTFKGVYLALQKSNPNISERLAVHEVIRKMHHERSAIYIQTNYSELLKVDGIYSLSEDIANICKAHGEDYSFLNSLDNDNEYGNYHYDTRYIAAILRIADLLDIDGQRKIGRAHV